MLSNLLSDMYGTGNREQSVVEGMNSSTLLPREWVPILTFYYQDSLGVSTRSNQVE